VRELIKIKHGEVIYFKSIWRFGLDQIAKPLKIKNYMDYKAPFLALPDYRENLKYEFIAGSPLALPVADENSGGVLTLALYPGKNAPARIDDGLLYPALTFELNGVQERLRIENDGSVFVNQGKQTMMMLAKFSALPADSVNGRIISWYLNYNISIFNNDGNPTVYLYCIDPSEEFENEAQEIINDPTAKYYFYTVITDVPAQKVYFYQDLVLKATVNLGGDTYGATGSDMAIGNNGGVGKEPDLHLAYMRLHSCALTLTEMERIQNLLRRKILGYSPKL